MEEQDVDEFEQMLLDDLKEDVKELEKDVVQVLTIKENGDRNMNIENLKSWREEAEKESEGGNGSGKFFKAESGKNRIRLLPGSYDKDLPFVQYSQNYIGGKFVVVPSEDNPLSRKGWELHNEFKDSDPDQAKAARGKWLPSKMVAVNVIDQDAEDKVPQIWVTSEKRMFEIVDLIDEYGDFFDVDKGRDLILTRSGTGQGTKYSIVPAAKPSKLEGADEILSQCEDLDDWLKSQMKTFAELEKIVEAQA